MISYKKIVCFFVGHKLEIIGCIETISAVEETLIYKCNRCSKEIWKEKGEK